MSRPPKFDLNTTRYISADEAEKMAAQLKNERATQNLAKTQEFSPEFLFKHLTPARPRVIPPSPATLDREFERIFPEEPPAPAPSKPASRPPPPPPPSAELNPAQRANAEEERLDLFDDLELTEDAPVSRAIAGAQASPGPSAAPTAASPQLDAVRSLLAKVRATQERLHLVIGNAEIALQAHLVCRTEFTARHAKEVVDELGSLARGLVHETATAKDLLGLPKR